MAIKLSCKNCNFKWKVDSEDRIPRTCPYCSKETVDWDCGGAKFRDVEEMLK
jgi:predicted Zn-ribbon and HTH transcriptional regulator